MLTEGIWGLIRVFGCLVGTGGFCFVEGCCICLEILVVLGVAGLGVVWGIDYGLTLRGCMFMLVFVWSVLVGLDGWILSY